MNSCYMSYYMSTILVSLFSHRCDANKVSKSPPCQKKLVTTFCHYGDYFATT